MIASTSRVFSSVTLATGVVRMIGAMARPGETPCVCVTRYDGGRRIGRTAFHLGPPLDALAEAVRRANGDARGRVSEVVATLPHGSELELEVSVERAPYRGTAVTFIRLRREDGEYVGNSTSISGAELASLAHACRWAQEAAQRPAEDT